MMGVLDGKIAVVTGAGAGYGRAIALALGSAGATVLAADRDPDFAEDTAAAIRELGGSAEGFAVHPCDSRGMRAMAGATVQHFGHIDLWVAAPLATPPGALLEATDEQWHAFLEDAVVAPQVAVQACAREMLASGHAGEILLVAPPEGDEPAAHMVRMNTLALARWWNTELAGRGIRVEALEPIAHRHAEGVHGLVAVACVSVSGDAGMAGVFAAGSG